jgi:hypothetical protein
MKSLALTNWLVGMVPIETPPVKVVKVTQCKLKQKLWVLKL